MLIRIVSCLALSLGLLVNSGCVTVVDATAKGPIQTDPSKRSFGTYLDDQQLTTIISVNVRKADPALSEAHINVHSYNAVVLLTGEVASKQLREIAGESARKVNRVRQVYNELSIGPESSFGARAHDNWLHSKIKTKLLLNKDIDSGRVDIIVESKVVYLMGMMSRVQAEKITEVVRKTKGVHKVVRAIEYID